MQEIKRQFANSLNVFTGVYVANWSQTRRQDVTVSLQYAGLAAAGTRNLTYQLYCDGTPAGDAKVLSMPAGMELSQPFDLRGLPPGAWAIRVQSSNSSDTAASIRAVIVGDLDNTSLVAGPVERFNSGRSCVMQLGDSNVASQTLIATVTKALYACTTGSRWLYRGAQCLQSSSNLHPVITKQGVSLSPETVAPGATYGGTSALVNRLPYTMYRWAFASNLGDYSGLRDITMWDAARIPWDAQTRKATPDGSTPFIRSRSFHATPNSIVSHHLAAYRAGGGNTNGNTYSAAQTPAAFGRAIHELRTTTYGTSGDGFLRELLYGADETGKEYLPIATGWQKCNADGSRVNGVVWAGELALGGMGIDEFLQDTEGANPAALGLYSNTQLDAVFEAHASIEPIDTLLCNLGINDFADGSMATLGDRGARLIERYVTLAQRHSDRPVTFLWLTPTPFMGGGLLDRTSQTAAVRDQIFRAVELVDMPQQVAAIDVHQAMINRYGPLTSWYSSLLDNIGGGYYIHYIGQAGAEAFGAAINDAMETAASSYQAGAAARVAVDYTTPPTTDAIVTAINADATQTTARAAAVTAAAVLTDGTAGLAAQYSTLVGLGEQLNAVGESAAEAVELLGDEDAGLVAINEAVGAIEGGGGGGGVATDVEGAHVPVSRTTALVRRGSSLYSETPLAIKAGENGAHAPLFATSFAKDLAGGGQIYQVTSITVVTAPAGAGEEDLVIVGDPKRNGPEARFVLAAADAATAGRYQLLIAVIYAGGAGGAEAVVDVTVGAASSA